MKKKIILLIILLIFVAIGTFVYIHSNKHGNISHVKTSFTSTDHHSADDIKQSMDIVKDFFKSEYNGCTLTNLWYDDEVSLRSEDEWKQQYHGKEAIILLSDFNVDASGGDGSLTPNETYTCWEWILVKNSDDKWILETWGYQVVNQNYPFIYDCPSCTSIICFNRYLVGFGTEQHR